MERKLKLEIEELEERIAPGVLTVGPPAADAAGSNPPTSVPGGGGPSVPAAAAGAVNAHSPISIDGC